MCEVSWFNRDKEINWFQPDEYEKIWAFVKNRV